MYKLSTNRETPMLKQLTLDLDVMPDPPKPSTYVEAFLGLTDWKKTADDPPPFLGWWKTWNEQGRAQRQWWNGHVWSIPTLPGPMPYEEAEEYKQIVSHRDPGDVLWSGLCRPHLARYLEYNLVKSPRVEVWEKLHAAT